VKTSCVIAALSLFALLLAPALVGAEEGGWSMPNLNPFAKKSNKRISASVSDAPTSGLKWPKLWPSSTAKASRSRGKPQPSTWQKMTAGTKSAVTKTADVLNPFDDANDNKKTSITGSNTVFSQASKNKSSKSKSFLPSWPSWGAEEKNEPRTVNEFLGGEKPGF
jgi:hypothetical protein